MSAVAADPQALRNRRKQDLLLASALARNQAIIAIGDIGRRTDAIVLGYRQVRGWMAVPHLGMASSLGASLLALIAMRRGRAFRTVRWALVGWRGYKLVTRLLHERRAGA